MGAFCSRTPNPALVRTPASTPPALHNSPSYPPSTPRAIELPATACVPAYGNPPWPWSRRQAQRFRRSSPRHAEDCTISLWAAASVFATSTQRRQPPHFKHVSPSRRNTCASIHAQRQLLASDEHPSSSPRSSSWSGPGEGLHRPRRRAVDAGQRRVVFRLDLRDKPSPQRIALDVTRER